MPARGRPRCPTATHWPWPSPQREGCRWWWECGKPSMPRTPTSLQGLLSGTFAGASPGPFQSSGRDSQLAGTAAGTSGSAGPPAGRASGGGRRGAQAVVSARSLHAAGGAPPPPVRDHGATRRAPSPAQLAEQIQQGLAAGYAGRNRQPYHRIRKGAAHVAPAVNVIV